jgi:hypothetical protein
MDRANEREILGLGVRRNGVSERVQTLAPRLLNLGTVQATLFDETTSSSSFEMFILDSGVKPLACFSVYIVAVSESNKDNK